MRKILFFALVALVTTAAAQAQTHEPTFNAQYGCTYSNNSPWTNEVVVGAWSIFTQRNPIGSILYGTEIYRANTSTGQDNRKIAFAKPVDFCRVPGQPGLADCDDPYAIVVRTKWELTIKDGVQCTNTVVTDWGRHINFSGCSNGKSRTCVRAW